MDLGQMIESKKNFASFCIDSYASPAERTAPATGRRRRRGAPQTTPKQDADTAKPTKRAGGVPQDPPETAGLLPQIQTQINYSIYLASSK